MFTNTLESFDFGGPAQWALVRGRGDGPVLLLVQAGPGVPMIQDADALERALRLEETFRVVYWDQRGTGKSFSAKDKVPISVETSVGDVRSMVRALCERLRVRFVDVVGFSFGASMSLLACEDESLPVRSLACVGIDVDLLANEQYALAFALREAERRGHSRARRALEAIGPAPHADTKRFMERLKWVANFGGVHRRRDFGAMLRGMVARLWSSPHYSLAEMLGALRGMRTTQDRMLPSLQGFNLLDRLPRVRALVAVFQGRHDAATVPELSAKLAERLKAELVWFEDSAHTPHEEEPARFRAELLRFIGAPAAVSSSARAGPRRMLGAS